MYRLTLWLSVVVLMAFPGLVRSDDTKTVAKATEPTVVAHLKSFDEMFADIRYLAQQFDQGNAVEQLDGAIKAMTGDGGLTAKGLDVERPFLVYVGASEGGIDVPPFAIMVPVSDEAKLLKWLADFDIVPAKDKRDIYSLMVPGLPTTLHFRFANKYVYLSAMDKSNLDEMNLVAPEKISAADPKAFFGLTLRISQIPDSVKQLALGQIELRLADFKDRPQPGESKEQERRRRQGIDAISYALKVLLSEGKSLEAKIVIDRDKDDLGVSIALDGQPNTILNNAISILGTGKTQIAVAKDAALHLGVNLTIPEMFRPLVEMGAKDIAAREADPEKKAIIEKLYAALEPTLKRGVIDLHVAATSAKLEGPFTILAGVAVQDTAKIETAMKELVGKLPEAERTKIQLNAEKADGVSLHKVTIDEKDINEEGKKLFGAMPSLWAGFGAGTVLLGMGPTGGETIRSLHSVAPPHSSPAIIVEGSLVRLAALDRSYAGSVQLAQSVFGGVDSGNDRVRITLDGGAKLKIGASFKGAALKYASQLEERRKGL